MLFVAAAEEQTGAFHPIPLTRGPAHHFFGYFGVSPWDEAGGRFLVYETAFDDRMPLPGETAAIGFVDLKNGGFVPLAETRAWNFQQGAMARWLPGPASRIIFNDREGGRAVSVILNVETGERRVLPRPISAISPDGRTALGVSYARMSRLCAVTGYPGRDGRQVAFDSVHEGSRQVYTIDVSSVVGVSSR